jgi:hypothetical protein
MPVLCSLGRTFRYHLGSLALGALVLAVIQTVRVVLMYIQSTLKRHKENKVAQMILTCLQCCCACIESIMRYLNKNAYIEV